MSKQKADQKAQRKANETALKGFPKAKLKQAFGTMAAQANDADASTEARQTAAHDVVKLAHTFCAKHRGAGIDVDTIVTGWRDNMALVCRELAAEGNRFAELSEAKGDKQPTAKFTGYGNNVVSIAKGVIEFELEPEDSYRETRKAVEAKRQERRREENPAEAALIDAKAAADEAWSNLRKRVFETNQLGSVTSLTEMLVETLGDVNAQIEAQLKADAQADAIEADLEQNAA